MSLIVTASSKLLCSFLWSCLQVQLFNTSSWHHIIINAATKKRLPSNVPSDCSCATVMKFQSNSSGLLLLKMVSIVPFEQDIIPANYSGKLYGVKACKKFCSSSSSSYYSSYAQILLISIYSMALHGIVIFGSCGK